MAHPYTALVRHPAALCWAQLCALERPVKASGRVELVRDVATGSVVGATSRPYSSPDGYGGGDPDPSRAGGGPRGKIRELSAASRRRLVAVAVRLIAVMVGVEAGFASLTYGEAAPEPATAKAHLEALRERMRRSWPDVFGLWVLERQRRGAPHFHLVLAGFVSAEDGDRFGEWLAAAWLELTGCGGSSAAARQRYGAHWRPVTSAGELVSYLTSELSGRKAHQKQPGSWSWSGRWWGYIQRDRVIEALAPVEVLELDAEAVAERLQNVDRVMRPAAIGAAVMVENGEALELVRVTWPAQAVRHHAARYLVSGDLVDLLALRDDLASKNGTGADRFRELLGVSAAS